MNSSNPAVARPIHWLVAIAGIAALSWEAMWQLKSSLALGVSAQGTALTLAATMGGMSIGSFVMGYILRDRPLANPVRLYGALEIIIGIAGLCLGEAFAAVENLDTWAYSAMPDASPYVHILGIVAVLGIPTICMGATLPVFGRVAAQFGTSVARLYGLNTLGAATGALLTAFLFIPQFGVTHAGWLIACINIGVGTLTWFLKPGGESLPVERAEAPPATSSNSTLSSGAIKLIVIVTGFATFALEIAWFRSLTAAFNSTTDAFAVMLASVLIALGLAAKTVPELKRKNVSLGLLIILAGVLILIATPRIERFDLVLYPQPTVATATQTVQATPAPAHTPVTRSAYQVWNFILYRFLMTLCVIGPPVFLLGTAFPWILDEQRSSRRLGRLYALNTFAAIIGSISAAWIFLPMIGFARTAWIAGILVTLAGIIVSPRKQALIGTALGVFGLLVAVTLESGSGTTRVLGPYFYADGKPGKILEFHEGPDVTTSVLAYTDGSRRLLIDGASASGQTSNGIMYGHYLGWMGHLPMLLSDNPKNALVICFGTGQTANAVREENPEALDIVDINPQVFKMGHNFPTNKDVLLDPRVTPIVMDGRAYVRRSKKLYDAITLEPMPPTLAGVNALYSKEFYEHARERLAPHGIIAQWLPFHAVAPYYSASIAKTFLDVFPNAMLWVDPVWKTGILLGSRDNDGSIGLTWPGFARTNIERNMTEDEVRQAILLNPTELKKYASYGQTITDDNQLLAYGNAVYAIYRSTVQMPDGIDENLDFLDKVMDRPASP